MTVSIKSNVRAKRRLAVLGFSPEATSDLILDRMKINHLRVVLSTYKLTGATALPCMFIRRSSDNAIAAVGFDSRGVLSLDSPVTATDGSGEPFPLSGFALGSDCFVVQHFDQSGMNNHAIPPSVAAQPKIVSAGSLIKNDGSGPLVAFDGIDDQMVLPFLRTHPHNLLWSGSAPNKASAGLPFILDGSKAGQPTDNAAAVLTFPGSRQMFAGAAVGDGTNDQGRYRTYGCKFAGSRSEMSVDGVVIATGDTRTRPATDLLIGVSAGGAYSNTSYSTIIASLGLQFDSVGLAQALMALTRTLNA